jgi:hypothetical protein
MVAQMAPGLQIIPQDDSRPGLPGELEELGRVVERHFEGSINFLASHVELGRAMHIIEVTGQNWRDCSSIEAVEIMAKEIVSPKTEANPSPAPKVETPKPAKVKVHKAETKKAPAAPAPAPEPVLEPEVRFTPGLVIAKDGVDHVVCQGKFGQCLRLVPMNEARVAVVFSTIMRAIGVKRLEEVTVHGLLQKSFCPKCAQTVLPLGSQTVPEAMAAIENMFADERATEEARLQREAEERVDARIAETRSHVETLRDGSLLACGLGLVRPPRRVQGKIVPGVSKDEYRQLGRAAIKIRNSGLTAADVRAIKNWTVPGVIRMAELKLQAMLS